MLHFVLPPFSIMALFQKLQTSNSIFSFKILIRIAMGYQVEILFVFLFLAVKMLYARHFKILPLTKICLLMLLTGGLLMAGPLSLFLDGLYMAMIEIPICTLLTIAIDYFILRLVLKTYYKKVIIKYVIYSNLTILIPVLLFSLWLRFWAWM